jgi:hypothetical protein
MPEKQDGHYCTTRKKAIFALAGKFTPSSSFDDLIADCVPYELADRVDFQLAHDVGAVRLGGLYADAEGGGHFLAALAFREQLYDFALPRG